MTQYIDKDALVAWAKETYLCENASMIRRVCYKQLLEYLNTLEVKEVDLTEEINFYIKGSLTGTNPIYTKGGVSCIIEKTAKHFFELGMTVNNKTKKGE